jgi:hypothetical protein
MGAAHAINKQRGDRFLAAAHSGGAAAGDRTARRPPGQNTSRRAATQARPHQEEQK